jgi:LacI family transcriptional regulator
VLAGPPNSSASAARASGFQDALRDAGVTPVNSRHLTGEITRASGDARAAALLAEGHGIDAFICGNDVIALGALDACGRAGLRVPEDVALTGFDDMEFSSVGPVQLTTVFVPRERIGRRGVELVLRRVAGDDSPPVEETLPHQLRVRATS